MSTVNFAEFMARLVAVEKEIIPTADAVPYALHHQDGLYFTNQLDAVTIESNSQDFDVYTVVVNVLLVAGNKTQGYHGELEVTLQGYIGTVIATFNSRETLRSAAYNTDMNYLRWVRCAPVRPLVVTDNSGTGDEQIAAVFTLTCEFEVPLEQDYP